MQYIDNYYDKVNSMLERSPDTANAGGSPACRNAPSRPDTTNLTRVVSESIRGGAEFGSPDTSGGAGFQRKLAEDNVAMPYPSTVQNRSKEELSVSEVNEDEDDFIALNNKWCLSTFSELYYYY